MPTYYVAANDLSGTYDGNVVVTASGSPILSFQVLAPYSITLNSGVVLTLDFSGEAIMNNLSCLGTSAGVIIKPRSSFFGALSVRFRGSMEGFDTGYIRIDDADFGAFPPLTKPTASLTTVTFENPTTAPRGNGLLRFGNGNGFLCPKVKVAPDSGGGESYRIPLAKVRIYGNAVFDSGIDLGTGYTFAPYAALVRVAATDPIYVLALGCPVVSSNPSNVVLVYNMGVRIDATASIQDMTFSLASTAYAVTTDTLNAFQPTAKVVVSSGAYFALTESTEDVPVTASGNGDGFGALIGQRADFGAGSTYSGTLTLTGATSIRYTSNSGVFEVTEPIECVNYGLTLLTSGSNFAALRISSEPNQCTSLTIDKPASSSSLNGTIELVYSSASTTRTTTIKTGNVISYYYPITWPALGPSPFGIGAATVEVQANGQITTSYVVAAPSTARRRYGNLRLRAGAVMRIAGVDQA